jgi:hypothetical protein
VADPLADQQTQTSLKGFWDKDPLLGGFAGPLRVGRLKSPALPAGTGASKGGAPQTVYAQLMTAQGEHKYYAASVPVLDPVTGQQVGFTMTGTPYVDVREVTITAWGSANDLSVLAQNIAQKLFWLPKNGVSLPFDAPVSFMVLKPTGQPSLSEDPTTKEGKDVFMLIVRMELMTTRFNA